MSWTYRRGGSSEELGRILFCWGITSQRAAIKRKKGRVPFLCRRRAVAHDGPCLCSTKSYVSTFQSAFRCHMYQGTDLRLSKGIETEVPAGDSGNINDPGTSGGSLGTWAKLLLCLLRTQAFPRSCSGSVYRQLR